MYINKYSSIFSQILSLFPRLEFEKLVKETEAERRTKGFTSWGQFGTIYTTPIKIGQGKCVEVKISA